MPWAWVLVSHHVDTGNKPQVLWKSHLSSPKYHIKLKRKVVTVCLNQGYYRGEKNPPWLKNLGKKGAYSAYSSTSLLISKGSQNRNSNRTWRQELSWGSGGEALLTGLLPMAASACFLFLELVLPAQGCPTQNGLGFPHQLLIKSMPYMAACSSSAIVWSHFLNGGPLLCDDSGLCQDGVVASTSFIFGVFLVS